MTANTIAQPILIFPREFERKIWNDIDKRYYLILMSTWITIYSLVTILGNIEFDADLFSERARAGYMKMLQDYPVSKIIQPVTDEVTDVMAQDTPADADIAQVERSNGSNSIEGQGPSAVEMIEQRRANEAARTAARRQMETEVGQAGILGVLSTGSSSGSGSSVVDAFISEGIGSGNLEEIISEVSGLAVSEGYKERTRLGNRAGGRVTNTADVNELLSGIGPAGSTNIGRKGSISVALETARVSGAGSKAVYRSSDEISRVINTHGTAIEYCYKRESKLNPSLRGSILVEFVIGINGIVRAVRILNSTIANKSMKNCITDRIRGWRFKPISQNEGDVVVKQKYIFN
jgi:hypothetical protein